MNDLRKIPMFPKNYQEIKIKKILSNDMSLKK